MIKTAIWTGLVVGLAAGSASAGETLLFGPVPDWVKPMTIATTASRDGAVQPYAVLSQSIQVRFSDEGDTVFSESAVRIQTPGGLDAGQPTTVWDPALQTVVVNKANLIRNGQVIDLLKRGQDFVILRRERSLGQSILDGRRTAFLQVDGVQVGDVVDFATTTTTRVDVLNKRSEDLWEGMSGRYAGSSQLRFVWPNDKPMHWRKSDDLPVPVIVKGAAETEFTLTLTGHRWPALATDAPPRFNRYGALQFSQFDSWSEVSALMAPYYDRAASFSDTSPLSAEVARIKAVSDDPKVQAAAALQLVEDVVRYASNDAQTGGFVPASADMTWLRRWGDCKAKSALLVGLLRQLGIKADPILVDTTQGDVMDSLLPALALFDHVIVRAVIGGKTYWLDGTGLGDGALDNLDVPAYKWYLPMVAGGETLRALPQPPLERSDDETRITIDASGGISEPAPAHLEYIQRGGTAAQSRLAAQSKLPEDLDEGRRAYWKARYPWVRIESVSGNFDPDSGEMRYVMDGTAELEWISDDGKKLYVPDDYWVSNSYFSLATRKKGVHDQAPVAVEYPIFERVTQTIKLPNGGAGFSIIGGPVETTVAGIEIKRRMTLKDGAFVYEGDIRTVASETPLADAKAAGKAINAINMEDAYLLAPVDTLPATGAAVAHGLPAADETDDGTTAPSPAPGRAKRSAPEPVAAPLTLHDVAEIYAGRKLPK